MGVFGALGKLVMSLGRELFGSAARGTDGIVELAEKLGVKMDALQDSSPEELASVMDTAVRQRLIDPRDANNVKIELAKDAQRDMPVTQKLKVYHGGLDPVLKPDATQDPEGLPMGFSVTQDKDIAKMYADMKYRYASSSKTQSPRDYEYGYGNYPAVTEYEVNLDKYNPITEGEYYKFIDDLEIKMGLDEGDATEGQIAQELKKLGYNAIEYPDPDLGIRIIDPKILKATAEPLRMTDDGYQFYLYPDGRIGDTIDPSEATMGYLDLNAPGEMTNLQQYTRDFPLEEEPDPNLIDSFLNFMKEPITPSRFTAIGDQSQTWDVTQDMLDMRDGSNIVKLPPKDTE